ncbi:MAG: dockerin type I repeat-containing protein [Pirellulales bacterium]
MTCLRLAMAAACAVAWGWAGSREARAQHIDVLALGVYGRLVTGRSDCADSNCSGGARTLGQRVFAREFDSDFLVNNPGFNAPTSAASLPPGSQALPAFAQLNWDFLPIEIGALTSNLFYWDGSDSDGQPGLTPEDVAFGAPPGAGYALTMFDVNSNPYSVHGSDRALVPGGRIATTSSTGFIHQHNYFLVDDGSGYMGTPPAEGIYLWALHLRMAGMQTSLPFYMVFGTLHSSIESLDDAALPWIEQQLDLSGDYNGDGSVDAADYTVWRDTVDQTGQGLAADGNGDQIVDLDDLAVWKQHFEHAAELRIAASAGTGGVVAIVPEPGSTLVLLAAAVATLSLNQRSWRARPAPGLTRPRC